MVNSDPNCLSYWFPKIEAAGLPVPRTEIVTTDVILFGVLMGEQPKGYDGFLVELRQAVERIGLSTNIWAIREFLPVKLLAVLPRYGNMPAVREWRCFVRDGKLECQHPYWPADALAEGIGEPVGAESLFKILARSTPEIEAECTRLAEAAGKAVGGGYWSVDVLQTARGLYLTDMAQGDESFHWPERSRRTPCR
jgi:hypothetical protein